MYPNKILAYSLQNPRKARAVPLPLRDAHALQRETTAGRPLRVNSRGARRDGRGRKTKPARRAIRTMKIPHRSAGARRAGRQSALKLITPLRKLLVAAPRPAEPPFPARKFADNKLRSAPPDLCRRRVPPRPGRRRGGGGAPACLRATSRPELACRHTRRKIATSAASSRAF